jgi:hypothetical protein
MLLCGAVSQDKIQRTGEHHYPTTADHESSAPLDDCNDALDVEVRDSACVHNNNNFCSESRTRPSFQRWCRDYK